MKVRVVKPSEIPQTLVESVVGFDIETTGLDVVSSEITVIQLYDATSDVAYLVPINTAEGRISQPEVEVLKQMLPRLRVVGHMLQFDITKCLYEFGGAPTVVGDTFLLARILQLKNQALKDIAVNIWPKLADKLVHFDHIYDVKNLAADSFSVKDQRQVVYMAYDPYLPVKIEEYFKSREWWAKNEKTYQTEIAFLNVVVRSRVTGIKIDLPAFEKSLVELGKQTDKLYAEFTDLIGRQVKIHSPKDLQRALFEELGLTSKHATAAGNPSTNQEALEAIQDQHEVIPLLLELKHVDSVYRSALKVPTYLDSEDVARPFVEQIGYDGTARVYTSDPSINQWPWEVRASIVPRPGFKFVFFDWSAAELAFAAYWSNCRDLIDRYEAGEDLHRFVSAEILGKKTVTDAEREVSKVVVFATIFGSEGAAVARSLKCSPEEGAQKVLKFLDRFPEIREKRDLVFAYSDKTKFTKNIFGRYRKLDLMFSQNEADIQKGHRQAFNTAIQGGIADCYKRAVIKLGKYEEKGIRYVCGVFDSILLEVPEQMAESEYRAVVDDLSFIDEIGVKFRYKIGEGKTWVEAKNQSH